MSQPLMISLDILMNRIDVDAIKQAATSGGCSSSSCGSSMNPDDMDGSRDGRRRQAGHGAARRDLTAGVQGFVTEGQEIGAPFFFATNEPPTAAAIDDDIYLTVTTAVPDRPGEVEAIDIVLSVEFAQAIIAQLSTAVIAARHDEAVLIRSRLVDRRRNRDAQSGMIVRGPAVEAMQVGDRGDERETKTVSRSARRIARTIEALEDR